MQNIKENGPITETKELAGDIFKILAVVQSNNTRSDRTVKEHRGRKNNQTLDEDDRTLICIYFQG